MQVLRSGSRGRDVQLVQQALNRCMLPPNNRFTKPALKPLIEDAVFGTNTLAMVREFQRLNQISQDGAVGPITSYLLLPFIAFNSQLAGKGRIRGRRGEAPVARVRTPAASLRTVRSLVSAGGQTGDDEEEEGITVNVTVGSGNGNSFKPWFVLRPNEESAEAPEAEGTVAIESTILRLKGFEFGGSLEFSRPLIVQAGDWQWAGSITGSYTNIKTQGGSFSLNPVADASVKQGLQLGAGVGIEASVHLLDDTMQLTVGGKVAAELDPHEGTLQVGPAVSVGLKFSWEVVRLGKK